MVEFVLGMQPFRGQTTHDRMIGASLDEELMLGTVATAGPLLRRMSAIRMAAPSQL